MQKERAREREGAVEKNLMMKNIRTYNKISLSLFCYCMQVLQINLAYHNIYYFFDNLIIFYTFFYAIFSQKSRKAYSQIRKNIESFLKSYQSDSIRNSYRFRKLKKKSFILEQRISGLSHKNNIKLSIFSESFSLTFKVTWAKAGTSSVLGLESLRELRVQGAVGMGNGVGPSLTHGGRKVVLCGG